MVGGVMTPLIGSGGDSTLRGGLTPRQTPRQTPFQTPGAMTPGRTPVRDQLSINTETPGGEMFEDFKQQQLEMQAQLKAGLSSLPAPKNDFELVMPEVDEDGAGGREEEGEGLQVEDAADVEERKERERKEKGKKCSTLTFILVLVTVRSLLLLQCLSVGLVKY